MTTSKAFLKLLVPLVALASTMNAAALDGSRSSANYVIRADTVDTGGQRTSSANYTMDDSVSGIGGISSAGSPPETAKHGYIGQLSEVTSLVVAVIPASVSETSNSQLNATAVLDDATILVLPGSKVKWATPSYPIAAISTAGLVTPASVYTDTTGTVSGYYLGASNSASLLVLDTNPDNFGIYASDGIPDPWQVQYFGVNNPSGTATADPDGDGLNNVAEFVAGTVPSNSVSGLRITAVARQGNDVRVTWTSVGGKSYALQHTKSAAIASYTADFADASPVIAVSGVGESTTNFLDAGAAYAPVLTPPGSPIASTGTPSTVNFSAANMRGLTDSLGSAVPTGSLLMLGTFSISESTIQSNFYAGNVSAIMSAFTPYTNSFAVGDGSGVPASWDVSRSAAGYGGQQLYLLAIDAPTVGKATHLGIFTAPSWVFPIDGDAITIDLQDVTGFIVGAHGGPLTINLPLGQTYTFDDTAKLSVLPGRILFYRVRLVP